MIYHLLGYTTVDTDILACDESCLVGEEEQHHIGNIKRIAHTSAGLLISLGAFVDLIGRFYPPRRYGVHTHLTSKARCQSMSERSNTAFCSGVALGLRLSSINMDSKTKTSQESRGAMTNSVVYAL